LRATVWMVVAYGSSQALRLVNSIVVTHLLMPEYLGLMALISTLVMGMNLLSDVGLLPSVINSPRGDEPLFLNTAWSIQIIRGFVLWGAALALAYPLSLLYNHDPRIVKLLPILGISLVINGFASTNLLTASRNIGVRRLLIVDLSAQVFGMIVVIVWAKFFPSIWALIGGTLSTNLAKTVLSHIPAMLPGKRNWPAWDKAAVHSLVHFGKWIMLGTAFYFFATQADRLILGRLVSFTILGVYNIAFMYADIPRQVILQFSYRVGFPFVAKMAHQPLPEFRKNVLKYRFLVLCAGAFILSLVINAGGPIVLKMYDRRYHAAGWMVPILALGLWHTLMYSTTSDILFSLGKPKYNAIGTGLYCATMFAALPLAFHLFGMLGAVISVAAGDLPIYFVLETGAAREKVSVWRQDALATAIFVTFVGAGFGLKRLIF
jgi:O-antigen/teichoic acid export membrane protein